MPDDPLRPTTAEVAAVIHNRTTVLGEEVGDFTTATNPSDTEVDDFIDHALAEVELQLPDTVPDREQPFAKRLVALRAAMMVEVSYDDDRTTNDTSTYARLKEMYDSGLALLLDALSDRDQGVTRRIASMPVVSPTLDPFPDDLREIIAPAVWPWWP